MYIPNVLSMLAKINGIGKDIQNVTNLPIKLMLYFLGSSTTLALNKRSFVENPIFCHEFTIFFD